MKKFESSTVRRPPAREQIEQLAYQLYVERGREPGHELEDWVRAEKILHLNHSVKRETEHAGQAM